MGRFLYIIAVVLVIIWAITFIGGMIASGLIHLLLIIAAILIVINLFGRNKNKNITQP